MKVALSSLDIGQSGVVRGFSKESRRYRQKLLAMGVTPGVSLEVIRFASFGEPIEIGIRGFCLSLRRSEANAVIVERNGA